MKLGHLIILTGLFLLVKFIQLFILYLSPTQFDISSTKYELVSNPIINSTLNKFIHWDNVYFNKLFEQGPSFEHEWVFGPLWWRLINVIPIEDKFVLGSIIVQILNYLSMILIYKLTYLKFKNYRKCVLSSILFILSPMGVFAIIPYSENLSNLFIVLGLYLYNLNSSISYLSSSILFSLSILTRSNTIILGVLFLYDFIIKKSILALIGGLIMGWSLLLLNYLPYLEFCPERSEWCSKTIPSIYTFAQSNYWNVGFLKYWTSNNLFNFFIASPMLILLFKSIKAYCKKDIKLSIIASLHLILCFFFIHVQIVLRISSFIPIIYWYLSDLIIESNPEGKIWILYLMIWIPLQTLLFGSFLPPA